MLGVCAFDDEQSYRVSTRNQMVTHVAKRSHLDTHNWHQTDTKHYHQASDGTGWTHIIVTTWHHTNINCHHMDTGKLEKGNHFKELRACVSKSGQ